MNYANEKKRLFGQSISVLSTDEISNKINFIKDNIIIKRIGAECKNRNGVSGKIPAGYTYLGQMLAHDIVPMTSMNQKKIPPPALNLSSIYNQKQYNNKQIFDSNGHFILGKSYNFKKDIHYINEDLPRDPDSGKALIPENRNDENVMVSQLHLLWLKLHNQISQDIKFFYSLNGIPLIERTREFMICIFNEIVRHDYLKRILHKEIYSYYQCNDFKTILYDSTKDLKYIPVEFSHAAFRFGHSMVRETYKIKNGLKQFDLNCLFLNAPKSLDSRKVIDWRFFFKYQPYRRKKIYERDKRPKNPFVGKARLIDTNIACGMYNVHTEHGLDDIRDLNLKANLDINKKIKNGDEILKALLEIPVYKNIVTKNNYMDSIYSPINKRCNELPLWPYILFESEKFNELYKYKKQYSERGKLGLVGSIIIAEVLLSSSFTATNKISSNIKNDVENYINCKINTKRENISMREILEFLKY